MSNVMKRSIYYNKNMSFVISYVIVSDTMIISCKY